MDRKSNQELEKQPGTVYKIREHLSGQFGVLWKVNCTMLYLPRSREITAVSIGAVLQEIIEQARNNLWSWHSRRGVNPQNCTQGLDNVACKCLSSNPLLNKWKSSRQQLLLSRTAQSREPSLPKSLTQYQAQKALLTESQAEESNIAEVWNPVGITQQSHCRLAPAAGCASSNTYFTSL